MLDGVALEVYKFAVAHPGWSRRDASEAFGYTLRDIDAAILILRDHRLLSRPSSTAEGFVAIPPDLALADLVDDDERTLVDLKARINDTRRKMTSLVPDFIAARQQIGMGSSVEVVTEPRLVHRVLIDYGREAKERVLIAQPGQGAPAEVHEEAVQKDVDLLLSGVERKTIYHDSTRDHVPTRKAVGAISQAGGEFRTLPDIPLRLMIFDRKVAVIARQLDYADKAALVIRDNDLVHTFSSLFHTAWEIASPFLEDAGPDSPLSSTQQSVLNGLAVGYSDEVIARRLEISVRTCRRHIAWMLEELGADSRFQAGIKARDAGWI